MQYLAFVEPALSEEKVHQEIRTMMRAHEIERMELQRRIQDLTKRVEKPKTEEELKRQEFVGMLYEAFDVDPDFLIDFKKLIYKHAKKKIEVANRLRSVQIENKDFREVIQIYDSAETLFYCDPPYFQAKPDYYLHSFSMKDHKDLARMLNKIKGKVCLSYYPHPKVEELYPNWKRDKKEVPCWSVRTKRKKKPRRSELLLMNY